MTDTTKPWEMNWNAAPAADVKPWEMNWQAEAPKEAPAYHENPILHAVRNVAEVPTSLISSLTTAPVAGLYHAIAHPSGKGFENDFVEGSQKGTYQPQNPTNQKIMEKIADYLDESKLAGAIGLPELEMIAATRGMPMNTAPITAPVKEAVSKAVAPAVEAIKSSPEADLVHNFLTGAQETQNQLKVENFNRDRAVKNAIENGYKVTPSAAGSGSLSRFIEGFGGQAKTAEAARIHNQTVTNNLAKKYLGIPENREFTTETINELKDIHNKAYEDIGKLPEITREVQTPIPNDLMNRFTTTTETVIPNGRQLLEDLKDTRFQAKGSWKKAFAEGDPEAFSRAKMLDLHAERLENQIDELAKAHDKPELIDNLKDARTNLAKIHTVDKAFNDETGNVNASIFRNALNKKRLLTDEALQIAKFSKAFPDLARLPKYAGTVPVSPIDVAAAAFGHGVGSKYADVMLARPIARSGVLSKFVQNRLVPNYKTTSSKIGDTLSGMGNVLSGAMDQVPSTVPDINPSLVGLTANQNVQGQANGGEVKSKPLSIMDIFKMRMSH